MSKLKMSENLFLEVNELKRLVKFLEEDGYKRIIKTLINSYGIVQNQSNSNFKVTIKSGESDVININPGLAFDSNLDAIVLNKNLEFTINNTGNKRWVILSRDVNNYEEGTISVNTDGSVIGVGTAFTEILRGQPNFPIKVKFDSTNNSGEYEVVSVISDSAAVISGSFTQESNLKFSVVGTFTPGFQPLEDNKQIYEYDSYAISIFDGPEPTITDDQFILSAIEFDAAGVMSITDERVNYLFNNNNVQGGYISTDGENKLVSLSNVNIIDVEEKSSDFELIVEHGYTVSDYELVVNPNTNLFNINSGKCNFLGTGDIPNGMFKNWILLNRGNMKYSKIDNNINKVVYISNLDASIMGNNSNNDFIIIPDFKEIEYQIKLSSNIDEPSIPFYFKQSIWNSKSRLRFHAFMPEDENDFSDTINVEIKYRMIDNSGMQYAFKPLSISQFINVKNQNEVLSESKFNIDLADIKLIESQRNYS